MVALVSILSTANLPVATTVLVYKYLLVPAGRQHHRGRKSGRHSCLVGPRTLESNIYLYGYFSQIYKNIPLCNNFNSLRLIIFSFAKPGRLAKEARVTIVRAAFTRAVPIFRRQHHHDGSANAVAGEDKS